jgi:flavin-dependent dehydrogenase
MQEYVVIVGASGPGLLAAYELARRGVPVRVYEQSETLSPMPRTLIVTTALYDALGFVPAPAIVHRIETFDLRVSGTSAEVTLRYPDLVVERSVLIELLAAQAKAAGAELHFGWRFVGFELARGQTFSVFRRRGSDQAARHAAPYVIGADGACSAVARAVGQPRRPLITNLQARIRLAASDDPRVSRVWFAPRDTPYFYWLIPDSDTTAVVGLAHHDPVEARPTLDGFLRTRGYDPIDYQAARIPMYQRLPLPVAAVGHTRVYLVGDAAAQVKVTTIGGTVTGLRGARAAARAILQRSHYARELQPLNYELDLHWLLRWLLNRFGEEDYSALLHTLNARLRALLHTQNRDGLAQAFWPLLVNRPQLLFLGARALVKAW